MAAEAGVEVHHLPPRCLLGLFAAAAGGLADWSEFDSEVERRGKEVCGLSREGLAALIEENGTRGAGLRTHRSHLQATRRT
jgi:hypothetical protein